MTTTTKPLTLLPEYRGHSISLEPKRNQHWYHVRGPIMDDLLPSVTTVLKVIDKSGPLIGWAKKTALEDVRRTLLGQVEFGGPQVATIMNAINGEWAFNPEWVDAMLEAARTRPDEVRDQAAAEGTEAHALLDRIIASNFTTSEIPPTGLLPAIEGGLAFIHGHNLTPVASELSIWHPALRYAGTVDLLARRSDGGLVLADWKRSSGIYPEYAYQAAAYSCAVERLYGESIREAWVVKLPKEPVAEGHPLYEARPVKSIAQSYLVFRDAYNLWSGLRQKPFGE